MRLISTNRLKFLGLKSAINTSYPKLMKNAWRSLNRYSKYRAVKTIVDGIKFDSKAEAALYVQIKASSAKEIFLQPKIYLTKAKILYKPDFFVDGDYLEMKGVETPSWKIKKRLWQHYGPGRLKVYKMRGGKPDLVEVINPGAYAGRSYKTEEN